MNGTLRDCKCVLGLFGPGYKSRIDSTAEKSGAYQEYNTIVTRLHGKVGTAKPKVIPVLWAGEGIEDTVPDLLMSSNPIVTDLRKFRTLGQRHTAPFLPEKTKEDCYPKLDKIAEALQMQEEIVSPEVEHIARDNLHRMLSPGGDPLTEETSVADILQVKYEHGKYDAESFLEHYYTKTRFSKRLKFRNVGLISGRKGSGKTTLVQIRELEAEDSAFFPVIDVSVNSWNIHSLIQNTSFTQSEGDFNYIDLEVRFFDFVWSAFVSLSMAISLTYHERNRSGEASPGVGRLLNSSFSAKTLDRLIGDAETVDDFDYAALFDHSVTAARRYIQKIVDQASSLDEESFKQDVLKGISIRKFLFDLFGNEFNKMKSAIYENGNKRFLFCFDRFDTEIQQYRKIDAQMDEKVKKRRSEREVNWLSSLTVFVNRTLRPDQLAHDRDIYEYFAHVKFLVVLPFDRIEEIRRNQRDSISSETVEEIRWQPKELLTMLRKRIQVLYGVKDDAIDKTKIKDALKRFEICRSMACPQLPDESHVMLGNKPFKMDLFLYVLRHTLFRPRDILIHYASILAYLESVKGRAPRDITEPIREIISQETQKIVEYEFVGELRDTWTNIDDVLKLFMGSEQVISAKNLEQIIGPIDFKFYHHGSDLTKFSHKLEFLYGIGFLGFRSTRQAGAGKNQNWFNFDFMTSQARLPFDSDAVMRHIEFAIHPIFVESLYLSTNHKKPVLLFDWRKLDELDRPD
ncbi:P-loop ATPase, Sll1717 family [Algirhabdus cladophorae]|uniref:P-loop ATPase, Sll1717 family n=1 Tax=Algirhabdus cladophorae TaxID=3377108 RepID=UPI003B846021